MPPIHRRPRRLHVLGNQRLPTRPARSPTVRPWLFHTFSRSLRARVPHRGRQPLLTRSTRARNTPLRYRGHTATCDPPYRASPEPSTSPAPPGEARSFCGVTPVVAGRPAHPQVPAYPQNGAAAPCRFSTCWPFAVQSMSRSLSCEQIGMRANRENARLPARSRLTQLG